MPLYYAVDIGGTKVEVAVGNEAGELIDKRRVETPKLGEGEAVMDALADLLTSLSSPGDIAGVGIACPGPLDAPHGRVLNPSNLLGWHYLDLTEGLSRRLHGLPCYIENDATAAGIGEWRWGAGRGTRTMVYVTVSTGIGSGIIAEGRILRGAGDNAGELGHVVVDPEGQPCHCGNRGCLETKASGTAIGRSGEARRKESPVLDAVAGQVTAVDVFRAVDAGDPVAVQVVDGATHWLAWAFGTLTNLFNPERIVVGGGVSERGEALLEPVRKKMHAFAMPDLLSAVEVVEAKLGPDVGVMGALAVALDRSQGSSA
ncbi:MAG: ROK family protein [Clostridia bacterium]